VHLLAFPVIAWVLFAAVNWGWHFSVLYDRALEIEWLHYLQYASFISAALLFWWPIVGADPSPWRMLHPVHLLYLFLAMPPNSFLGVALMSAQTVLFPHYVTNARTGGRRRSPTSSSGEWVPLAVERAAVGHRYCRRRYMRTARGDGARGYRHWQ
jgi:cytochrome c oxidase assembly factor CtaG